MVDKIDIEKRILGITNTDATKISIERNVDQLIQNELNNPQQETATSNNSNNGIQHQLASVKQQASGLIKQDFGLTSSQISAANAEIDNAEQDLSTTKTEAHANNNSANSQLQTTEAQANQQNQTAENNLNETQEQTQENISSANNELQNTEEQATSNNQTAQEQVNEANSNLDTIQSAYEEAKNAVTTAQESLTQAQNVLSNAKTEEERAAAQEQVQAAEKALESAKQNQDTKKQEIDNAKKAVEQAKSNQETVKKQGEEAVETAQENVTSVTEEGEQAVQEAEENVENIAQEGENAVQEAEENVELVQQEGTEAVSDATQVVQTTENTVEDAINIPPDIIRTADGQTHNINETIENRINNVTQDLEKVKSENGFIGKTWDKIKNSTGIGDSSNDVIEQQSRERELLETYNKEPDKRAETFQEMTGAEYTDENKKDFVNGKLPLKSETALQDYKEGQEQVREITTDIASGAAATATLVATGGNIPAAMAVGAGVKTGLKYADAQAAGREYSTRELATDTAIGAMAGPIARGASVAGRAVQAGVKKVAGNSLVARGSAYIARNSVEGAVEGAIDNAAREAINGGSAREIAQAATTGAGGGALLGAPLGAVGDAVGHAFSDVGRTLRNTADEIVEQTEVATSRGIVATASTTSLNSTPVINNNAIISTIGSSLDDITSGGMIRTIGSALEDGVEGIGTGSSAYMTRNVVGATGVLTSPTVNTNIARNAIEDGIENQTIITQSLDKYRTSGNSLVSDVPANIEDQIEAYRDNLYHNNLRKLQDANPNANQRELELKAMQDAIYNTPDEELYEHFTWMQSRDDLFGDLEQGNWLSSKPDDQRHNAWKMHLFSNNEMDWRKLSEAVIPYLKEHNINWKTINQSFSIDDLAEDSQAGKAFTIYPRSNDEMAQIARDLDYIIRNNSLECNNSNIIGDRQMGNTGRLFYRYEYNSGQYANSILDTSNRADFEIYHSRYEANRGENNYLALDMTEADDIWRNFDPSQINTNISTSRTTTGNHLVDSNPLETSQHDIKIRHQIRETLESDPKLAGRMEELHSRLGKDYYRIKWEEISGTTETTTSRNYMINSVYNNFVLPNNIDNIAQSALQAIRGNDALVANTFNNLNLDETTSTILSNIHKLKPCYLETNPFAKFDFFENQISALTTKDLVHETGHYLDYGLSSSHGFSYRELHNAVSDACTDSYGRVDNQLLHSNAQHSLNMGNTFLKEIKESNLATDSNGYVNTPWLEKEGFIALSDIYDALSGGYNSEFGLGFGGHGTYTYQNQFASRENEIFANYFTLRAQNNTAVLNILKQTHPDLSQALEESYLK